jgi:hypothetical protein
VLVPTSEQISDQSNILGCDGKDSPTFGWHASPGKPEVNGCQKVVLGNDLGFKPTRGAMILRYCELQVIWTRTGISFFTGRVRSEGGSILKSVRVAGMVPVIRVSSPCLATSKATCW